MNMLSLRITYQAITRNGVTTMVTFHQKLNLPTLLQQHSCIGVGYTPEDKRW